MFRYGHFGHGPGPVGWVVFALVVVLVVLGVVALVRLWRGQGGARLFGYGPTPTAPAIDPAMNELRIRYARGEVDWGEYAERAARLGYPVTPGPFPGGTAGPGAAGPPAPPTPPAGDPTPPPTAG